MTVPLWVLGSVYVAGAALTFGALNTVATEDRKPLRAWDYSLIVAWPLAAAAFFALPLKLLKSR